MVDVRFVGKERSGWMVMSQQFASDVLKNMGYVEFVVGILNLMEKGENMSSKHYNGFEFIGRLVLSVIPVFLFVNYSIHLKHSNLIQNVPASFLGSSCVLIVCVVVFVMIWKGWGDL